MKETTTGFWTVALGAATASGSWEGFRVCPIRRTAELRVDGALRIGEGLTEASDYALVLSHPALRRDRVLVAGKGGTIEFGHNVVELLRSEWSVKDGAGNSESPKSAAEELASLWLTDLTTGATSERCPLPRFTRSDSDDPPDAF
jgi:hypothetical protein